MQQAQINNGNNLAKAQVMNAINAKTEVPKVTTYYWNATEENVESKMIEPAQITNLMQFFGPSKENYELIVKPNGEIEAINKNN